MAFNRSSMLMFFFLSSLNNNVLMKTFLFFYFQVSSSLYYTQRRIPAIFGKREFVSNILFGVGLVVSKKNNKEVE